MRTIRHMSVNVKGALRNKFFSGWTDDNGREMTKKEAKEFLMRCESEGKRVIPLGGEPCEGYSYEKGCPGHPLKP